MVEQFIFFTGDGLEYQTNLFRNLRIAEEKGRIPTFMKTVEHTIRRYSGDQYRYENFLRTFIDNDFCTSFSDRGEFRMLSVNWDRVNKELAAV